VLISGELSVSCQAAEDVALPDRRVAGDPVEDGGLDDEESTVDLCDPEGCFSSISVTRSPSTDTVPNRADGLTTVIVASRPLRR